MEGRGWLYGALTIVLLVLLSLVRALCSCPGAAAGIWVSARGCAVLLARGVAELVLLPVPLSHVR